MTALQPTINAASAVNLGGDRSQTAAAKAEPAIPAKTWIAVIGATLGAFMAVLNIQIVNASLADIQGAIGAGIDDGGWISTSYLIAEIVVIPLSGWLAQVFSIRRYLLTNAVLFLLLSVACAFAQDLPQMIVLRAIQGFTGGVLIPMAFTLIITLLPKSKQPVGLALFALSATFAPAIGPTIGGYLTENWGWQFIFYVNLVPGAVMIAMLWFSLEAKPMKLSLLREGDWVGIATMAIGLSALQTVLEEGNKDDWFGSAFIVRLSVIAAVALTAFLWIELTTKKPLLNLRLLLRRNFGFGMLANFLLGIALYGSVFILPVYLSRIQGYNAEQIGMVLAWTGLPQLLLIPLVPRLMKRFDPRLIIGIGFALFAASNFMNIYMTNDYATDQLFWPNIVRALGQALVMAPLSAVATAGIEAENAGSASGLFNMMRNLGGAVGIAVAADLPDQARAVSLQRADAVGLDAGTGDPQPDRAVDPIFPQSRRRRSRRSNASRGDRDRRDRAEAGFHSRLQRHILPARRRADCRTHRNLTAEEAGPSCQRRRTLGLFDQPLPTPPTRRTTMKPRMNFYQAAPDTIKALSALETQIQGSGLEKSLIELVKTRASQINGCAYCINMHTEDARKQGETEQRLYLLNAWRESPLYTDRERAALAWTEALTLIAETHAPDDLYADVRAHFNEAETVNLTMLIGAINAWNRLAIAFRAMHPVKVKAAVA